MKRNGRNLAENPFLAWNDLAWKFGEMSMASAERFSFRSLHSISPKSLASA